MHAMDDFANTAVRMFTEGKNTSCVLFVEPVHDIGSCTQTTPTGMDMPEIPGSEVVGQVCKSVVKVQTKN
jgi:hypothetical protein